MSTASLDRPLFSASASFDCAASQVSGVPEKSVRSRVRSLCVPTCPVRPRQRVCYQAIPELGAANE